MKGNATLVVLENNSIKNYSLRDKLQWTIGRGRDNVDIFISSSIVARLHGQLINFDSEWFYTDNGSINGTYHNGRRIKNGINGSITPIILSEGDVLRIDSGNFENPDPRGVLMIFTMNETECNWNCFNIGRKQKIIIGEDKRKCDIIAEGDNITPIYFILKFVKGQMHIFNCADNFEILVNDKKIESGAKLNEKDVIRINNNYWIYSNKCILYNT